MGQWMGNESWHSPVEVISSDSSCSRDRHSRTAEPTAEFICYTVQMSSCDGSGVLVTVTCKLRACDF